MASGFGVHGHFHNQKAPTTEHDIESLRIKNGQCAACGLKTHDVRKSMLGRQQLIPRTNENVLDGRCLICHPLPITHTIAGATPVGAAQSVTNSASVVPDAPHPGAQSALSALSTSVPGPPGHLRDSTPIVRKQFTDFFAESAIGGNYIGAVNEKGERHGNGHIKWENGYEYDGSWKHDKKDGQGTYKRADGSVYKGSFKDDKKEGHGAYTFGNGNKHQGSYRDGLWDGSGTFWWSDGTAAVCHFIKGKMSGEGVRWSFDRQVAYCMKSGVIGDEISLADAQAIAKRIGLPVPAMM